MLVGIWTQYLQAAAKSRQFQVKILHGPDFQFFAYQTVQGTLILITRNTTS